MMIYKFPLREVVTDEVITVAMPEGAEILYVGSQKDVPCLWAMVNPVADVEHRWFYLAATGEELPTTGKYLGTVLQYDGAYVWHVLEMTK